MSNFHLKFPNVGCTAKGLGIGKCCGECSCSQHPSFLCFSLKVDCHIVMGSNVTEFLKIYNSQTPLYEGEYKDLNKCYWQASGTCYSKGWQPSPFSLLLSGKWTSWPELQQLSCEWRWPWKWKAWPKKNRKKITETVEPLMSVCECVCVCVYHRSPWLLTLRFPLRKRKMDL